MRKTTIIFLVIIAFASPIAIANPRPCYEIQEIQANPPRIGLILCDTLDLSGRAIYTSSGTAFVNQGVIAPPTYYNEVFYLDSTNTTGFIFNSESDSCRMNLYLNFREYAAWGTLGRAPVPLPGHKIELDMYPAPLTFGYTFSFDFADPRQGYTEVVLNEINAHGTWNSGSGFIELYNRGNAYTYLENWKLICDTILTLPQGATIHPHGFYVIDQSLFPSAWDMDSTGDNIYLINSANQTVDQVGWSSDHGADVSFMRFPDGSPDTSYPFDEFWGFDDGSSISFSDGFPTRGAPNSVNSPGLKVIGIRADTANNGILIQWTNPVWLSVFTQVILRKSNETFPATPFDGDLIYEGSDQEYLDTDVIPNHMAYYTVFARTSCGDYSQPDSQSQIAILLPSTGIGDQRLPEKPAILTCYPNPFNSSITFALSSNEDTEIAVYDITGARIADIPLVDGKARWNANGYSSGIYFAKALSQKAALPTKLIYLK